MSRKIKALVIACATAVQLALVVAVSAGPANATVGPADDRQMTVPTDWWSYTGVTAGQVSSLVSAN
ncbi:MAG: hypothetical protein LBV34_15995, partial [Nocardiopsaceae bacterium]|nr:hypothetical protein [Nocardiopsaceae bacterium]